MPCSRTQHGLTRVGLEPPTSGSGVRGINHQATAKRELGRILVSLKDTFPEAVYCLCTHITCTVFEVVPSRRTNSGIVLCDIVWVSATMAFVVIGRLRLSIRFYETQSVNCYDLTWRLLRTVVK